VGSDGLIKTATTNLWQWSNSAVNGETWNNVSAALDLTSGQADPVGGTTAIRASDADNDTGGTFIQRTNLTSLPTGSTVSYSIWLKPISCPNSALILNVFANGTADVISASFPVSGEQITGPASTTTTGTGVVINSSVTPYPNGWYRCALTGIPSTVTMTDVRTRVNLASYQRVQGTARFDWYGAQLEQSTTVGEYIPTTSTINSAPRFDHDPTTGESLGLLVEESRTNLLPSSEDVDYAGYQRSAITTSLNVATVTAPDGTTTADEIAPTATTGEHFIGYTTPANVISGTTYTFSAYVKPNGTDSVRIRFAFAGFNNENGSHVFSTNTTTSGTCDFRIAPVANGWYRIQGTVVASSTAVGQPRIYPNQSNSWLGVPSEALYVWGAQLEVGSFPTSYIPTEGSTVTRAADVASISGSNFSSWYNQSEGTTYYEAVQPLQFIPFQAIATFTASTIVDEWRIWRSNTNTAASTATVSSSISLSATINYFAAPNGGYAFAGAMKTDDAICAANGILSNADTSGQFPSFQSLRLGARSNNTFYWNGHISRLTYWPQRLPDSTLQTITQ
jgi:hypothetical protein